MPQTEEARKTYLTDYEQSVVQEWLDQTIAGNMQWDVEWTYEVGNPRYVRISTDIASVRRGHVTWVVCWNDRVWIETELDYRTPLHNTFKPLLELIKTVLSQRGLLHMKYKCRHCDKEFEFKGITQEDARPQHCPLCGRKVINVYDDDTMRYLEY